MFFRPPAKPLQRLNQGTPQLRKRMFHRRRHDRMNSAVHKTVALQAAQRLGKHFLRDSADLALKRGIPIVPPARIWMTSAVHLSAMRSSTSREGHRGSSTEGTDEPF